MKAAVVQDFAKPLVIEEVPTPVPGYGQVLVKVEASGLCHTDIHAAHGDWPVKPVPPFIPGHEGAGLVERVGPGVTDLKEGDRVAVPWLGYACGACELCASGWETLCAKAHYTGYTVNGGFAEYVLADSAFAGRVPAEVDPLDAAPLTCAGVTTYKAVKVSGVGPSDLVAVMGIGGLGHLAMQYAQIAGATVAAVDVVDAKLAVGGGDPEARGRRRRHRAGGQPSRLRAGFRGPAAQRHPGAGGPPSRQHHAAADLPDRAEGDQGGWLLRGHPR